MNDYDFPERDDPAMPEGKGPLAGLTLQTGASILLLAVIAAVLWLFFGPLPDSGLPTPTPTPAAAAALGTTTPSGSVTPGTPRADASGTPAGAASAPVSTAAAGATVAGSAVGATGMQSGAFVTVTSTDGYGIRYRFGPGTDNATIRIVDEGELLKIQGEPEQAEGFTWYHLQDAQGNVGWAVADFLQPAPAPTNWNPPAASPTFPVGMGSPFSDESTTPAAP